MDTKGIAHNFLFFKFAGSGYSSSFFVGDFRRAFRDRYEFVSPASSLMNDVAERQVNSEICG